MSDSVSEPESESSDPCPVPRLCQLHKWEGISYGFNLVSRKGIVGHFIGGVERHSPASYASLKNGDRLLEVNDIEVTQSPHADVVDIIKRSNDEDGIKMLVADAETEEYYIERGIQMTGLMQGLQLFTCPREKPITLRQDSMDTLEVSMDIEEEENENGNRVSSLPPNLNKKSEGRRPSLLKRLTSLEFPKKRMDTPGRNKNKDATDYDFNLKPRLCYMKKSGRESFGFVMRTFHDNLEKVILRVEECGVAARTSVQSGDRIIEINGVNVQRFTHSEATARILSRGDVLSLFVVTEQELKYFNREGIAVTSNSPYTYHTTQPPVDPIKRDSGADWYSDQRDARRMKQYVNGMTGPSNVAFEMTDSSGDENQRSRSRRKPSLYERRVKEQKKNLTINLRKGEDIPMKMMNKDPPPPPPMPPVTTRLVTPAIGSSPSPEGRYKKKNQGQPHSQQSKGSHRAERSKTPDPTYVPKSPRVKVPITSLSDDETGDLAASYSKMNRRTRTLVQEHQV